MTGFCMHIAGVRCDNCQHTVQSPVHYTATVSTTGTVATEVRYPASWRPWWSNTPYLVHATSSVGSP